MKVINNLLDRMRPNVSLLSTLAGGIGAVAFLMFVILVVILLSLSSCTDDTDANRPTAAALTPLSATALLPQDSGSGSITRGFTDYYKLADLTLYYPASGAGSGENLSLSTYYPAATDITQANNSKDFSFTTTSGSKTQGGASTPLYWRQIEDTGLTTATFYLTVAQTEKIPTGANASDADTGNILWGTYTVAGSGDAGTLRPSLAFGTLKSRLARFTLIIKCKGDVFALKPELMTAYVYTVPRAEANVATSGIASQAWPTTGGNPEMNLLITPVKANAPEDEKKAKLSFTGTRLIAPQALPAASAGTAGLSDGNLLVIRYNIAEDTAGEFTPNDPNAPHYQWTLDLSKVSVRRDTGNSDFATEPADGSGIGFAYGANFGYNPGEHITLTVTLSLASLMPGNDILKQIDDYEAGAAIEDIEVPVEP